MDINTIIVICDCIPSQFVNDREIGIFDRMGATRFSLDEEIHKNCKIVGRRKPLTVLLRRFKRDTENSSSLSNNLVEAA